MPVARSWIGVEPWGCGSVEAWCCLVLPLVRLADEVVPAGGVSVPKVWTEFSFRNFSESRKASSMASLAVFTTSANSSKIVLSVIASFVLFQQFSTRTNQYFRASLFFSNTNISSESRLPLVCLLMESRTTLAFLKQISSRPTKQAILSLNRMGCKKCAAMVTL